MENQEVKPKFNWLGLIIKLVQVAVAFIAGDATNLIF